ncbi:MAG TPA: DoxX family protein [Jiangellaceae bacterium]
MSLIRRIARPMLASVFVVKGARTLLNPDPSTVAAKPVTDRLAPTLHKYAPKLPTDARTLVRANAGVKVGAGLLLATGRLPRISSLALAASLVPTTLAEHAFWNAEDPDERQAQREAFLRNVALAGGLLIAGADTAGKPGLAWRASHAADDSRRRARYAAREARHTAREARLSARAAKAGLASKLPT